MPKEDQNFRGLLVSLYDAAGGAVPWDGFLSEIGQRFTAPKVYLFSQAPDHQAEFFGAVGLQQPEVLQYQRYYCARNILLARSEPHVPGTIRTTETICAQDLLLKSEYYNDFMRPNDMRYTMGVTALRTSDSALHLSMFRPPDAGAFTEGNARLLSELYPHLQSALRVHVRLAEKQQRAAALEEAFNSIGYGVGLADHQGRLVYANAALERILQARDGLSLGRDGISASDPAARQKLRATIADASRGGSGGALSVGRPSGKPPYSVVAAPVLKRIPFLGRVQAAVTLIVSDPASARAGNVIRLQQAYGLTAAEARVASRLASGASLREIAEQLAISIHTARTHLKRALAKTGCQRQGELVRRILLATAR